MYMVIYLFEMKGMTIKGVNEAEIDMGNKSNAMYFVTLINEEGERKTIKLIKGK